MRFRDRKDAGQRLAKRLHMYAGLPRQQVLALPRGGVVVAYEIAAALDIPLDVLNVRKLGAPCEQELAIGAIAAGGICVLNHDIIAEEGISQPYVDAIIERETRELLRREQRFRQGRAPLDLEHRPVILVDDGLATGATMWAAIVAVRAQKPACIVVAVPVAPPFACCAFKDLVKEVICLTKPHGFGAVGAWYDDFPQVSDAEVCTLLKKAWDKCSAA
jgi:putative phosphoribosyl transferase